MNEALLSADAAAAPGQKILCVDDEPNILSSLRRLLRGHGYQIFVAEGGQAGLDLMAKESIDLVISDMRMPEMDGARFLEHVRNQWPDTIRLLLTGYADIQSILDAINRGEIYRYITKPWNDSDFLLIVRHALERKELEREKQRLESITQRQNEELRELNTSLESKVLARTRELKAAHDSLLGANEKLKINFLTSIKIFSSLIEMRNGSLAGHSRKVADLARRIATKMGLNTREVQEIFIAGLLHNIGKIAFSDDLLIMPINTMNAENLGQYRKYAVRGEQLLMPLEDLRETAKIVRSQQERFDGEGYPDRLSGFNIPLGARILAIAEDYFNLQIGTLVQRKLRPEEAHAVIMQNGGKRYDPMVAKAFDELLNGVAPSGVDNDGKSNPNAGPEKIVGTADLQPGMTIARDLITRDGFLLLSAGHTINEKMIRQIREFESSPAGSVLSIHIRQ
ncbi:MAG TPA: HD domain-containing phosphohydrolase [Burkholderiaceae bacterium]|jgi:response regulator RpfG family c-di-GMP phosphodiesterase|nr:HD domain-containing phosphohydrolase [Burkholderiaceae bacterium]